MIEPKSPPNEARRLAALRALNLLDTPPEKYFDRITEVAARIFGVPIALISLIDADRQWFKARTGLQAFETPRNISFCGHAILQDDILCVPDALLDARFSDNPLVTGPPHIRFYAGMPIRAPGGERIGTLCLIDSKPRQFSASDRTFLASLAKCAETVIVERANDDAPLSGGKWFGVLVTALSVAAFELLSTSVISIPNPPAILILAVVFAAFRGGAAAGLASSVIAWVYLAHFFSLPGQPFHYDEVNLVRVLVWALSVPSIAIMTGVLRNRLKRSLKIEMVNNMFANCLAERTAVVSELDAMNRQIRDIVDSAPTHIAFYDEKMICRYCNVHYSHWFGFGDDQVIGKHLREIIGEAAYALTRENIRRALAGEKIQYEATRVHADGSIRHIDATITPHVADDGRIGGIYAFFNDITERKRAEAYTRRSEQLKAATFAAALDAIISVDHHGLIVEFNPAAERCFGYSRAEVVGKPMAELLIPLRLRARHEQAFQHFLDTREANLLCRRIVLPALRADGTEIEVELTIIRIPDTEPPIMTAFARDVTEVRSAEAATRKSTERLDRALDGASLALFEIEVQSGKVYLSAGWAQMIGAEPGETHSTIGELLQFVHPDDQEAAWSLAMTTISGTRLAYDVEQRVRRCDGEWIWVLSRGRVVERDATGRSVLLAGTNLDITERKRNEQRLHYLATRDALTDLANRAVFGDDLQKAITNASQRLGMVALVSIGLDRFTMINDSFGQSTGNEVIKSIAARIANAVSGDSLIARPGGDEFLVLLRRPLTVHEVAACAETICAAVMEPLMVEGRKLVVTASIGIALYPDDGESAGVLLRNADIALHTAKDAGRDNVQFFAETMNAIARSRLDTEAALRLALEREEFIIYYQPQVELASCALIGFDALVRWKHPQRGLVPPAEFVPIAENSGLITSIGERLLAMACRQAMTWQKLSSTPISLAVNVAARQFQQKGFVKIVKSAIASAGLDPKLLELEITENAIMEHGVNSMATLDAIRDMGVLLAIDDFGTGYSSLSYLKRLPVDTLKIDQSFIADLPADPEAGAIVRAIIALAHNLGLKVLAEGVETREQFMYLREHGCDRAQGYYFGRPQPPELLQIGNGNNVVVINCNEAA